MDKMIFTYSETTNTTEEYALHCHNHYEIYYFLEGEVDYLVEGQKYQPAPDSLLLFAPNVFHGVKIKSEKPYRRYTIHFDPEVLPVERRAFLLSAFPSPAQEQKRKVYFEQADQFRLNTYFHTLEEYTRMEERLQEQMLPIGMESLLARIVYLYELENGEPQSLQSDTISRIIWYLNQNLKDEISLDQLVEKFFISKHHLNKVFRKAVGTTVFDYLIRKRVSLAQQLLMNGFGAQEAAAEAGFKDYSAFYRSYIRVLGHAPSCDRAGGMMAGRKEEKQIETMDLPKKLEKILTNN